MSVTITKSAVYPLQEILAGIRRAHRSFDSLPYSEIEKRAQGFKSLLDTLEKSWKGQPRSLLDRLDVIRDDVDNLLIRNDLAKDKRRYLEFPRVDLPSVGNGTKKEIVLKLIEDANLYYQAQTLPPPVKFTFDRNASDAENLRAAYRRFQGVCLGEYHDEVNGKRFLRNHMELLKELGVTTLFTEYFRYDEHQALLDAYFDNPDPNAEMPEALLADLERITYPFLPPYRPVDIFREAKRCGIRIVGIDIGAAHFIAVKDKYTNLQMCQNRGVAMNFVAEQIIHREKGKGKFLIYLGNAHAVTKVLHERGNRSRVIFTLQGLADRFQCPLISIFDDKQFKAEVNCERLDPDEDDDAQAYLKHTHLVLRRPKYYTQPPPKPPSRTCQTVAKTLLAGLAALKFRRIAN